MKKAVIITGAGSGIGEATALEFAKNDYFVFLLGRRLESLQNVLAKMSRSGEAIPCDLKDLKSVQQAIHKILNYSPVQVTSLVNNAGIFVKKKFEETSDEVWLEQFNTNLFGAVRITREIFPFFKKQKQGSMVHVSSTLGLSPMAETSAYSATKAAMVNWSETLALEGGPHGIRSNCVCPGLVDTPIHTFHSFAPEQKEKSLQPLKALQPLQRIGTPEEVAKAIFFLASDSSAWTTGSVLSVDGGINLL